MKAITVNIMKSARLGDCSNHGISSKYDSILLICEDGNIAVDGTEPNLCKVVKRNIGREIYYHVEPVAPAKGAGYMSGGTVVYSSDARFGRAGNGYPLSLHDRCESWEQYNMSFD